METKSDDEETEEKICRYCLDSKNSIDLISPCDCEGTSKYVHQDCLAKWIKTKHTSSLRINILQHGSIQRILQCTECRGNYKIEISPVSWNTFFYRLLFDYSNQKLLQKMALQIAWILFQSTTLSLVSKAFIKSVNQLHTINIPQTHQNSGNFIREIIGKWINSNINFVNGIKNNIKLFFYYLIHPILWMQNMVSVVINYIKSMVKSMGHLMMNPWKIVQCFIDYIRRFILFIRVTFLFVLIVQHTASITFNANKLYAQFKKHKLNLVKLKILGQNE